MVSWFQFLAQVEDWRSQMADIAERGFHRYLKEAFTLQHFWRIVLKNVLKSNSQPKLLEDNANWWTGLSIEFGTSQITFTCTNLVHSNFPSLGSKLFQPSAWQVLPVELKVDEPFAAEFPVADDTWPWSWWSFEASFVSPIPRPAWREEDLHQYVICMHQCLSLEL